MNSPKSTTNEPQNHHQHSFAHSPLAPLDIILSAQLHLGFLEIGCKVSYEFYGPRKFWQINFFQELQSPNCGQLQLQIKTHRGCIVLVRTPLPARIFFSHAWEFIRILERVRATLVISGLNSGSGFTQSLASSAVFSAQSKGAESPSRGSIHARSLLPGSLSAKIATMTSGRRVFFKLFVCGSIWKLTASLPDRISNKITPNAKTSTFGVMMPPDFSSGAIYPCVPEILMLLERLTECLICFLEVGSAPSLTSCISPLLVDVLLVETSSAMSTLAVLPTRGNIVSVSPRIFATPK